MFDKRWRHHVERVTGPVGNAVGRSGVSPDHLTATGLAFAAGATVAVGSGHLAVGTALYVGAALPDMFDGAVAKATGTSSARGAFFDSVADRVTDMAILGGIAFYLAGRDGGRAAMLPMAAMAVATLVSYERARGESLGYDAKGGLMERAERTIALMIGLAFPVLLLPVLWVMLALTSFTAVHRFVMVWRQAAKPPPRARPVGRPPRSGRGDRVTWAVRAERWRAWREQMASEGRARTGVARRERVARRRRPSSRP
ncbi:MAG: CDP-diacylglycerol---glycerol-3-phosphate 3-phosphatidyltransferase [Actinomycetota bacterium]|jgi:CDP-diacylglycerol--glycerol-3-phosphate 3-phosphatidyltransferase